ncbi:MAG: hypothetical protein IPG07_18010 [Crocinitomicaceae bacterium]|nr:hypothetical protein [Crocinitomicaceae bacterium]
MKKAILFSMLALTLGIPSMAQPPAYDDLLIYYADGDYEKLLKKAESYTLKEDTKNDAIPYLYLSKANFDMSKDQAWLDQYPKAYADAIKFAGSCMKKDKDSTVYRENISYFTELQITIYEEIVNLVETGNYPKLLGAIPKLHKIAANDVGSYFLKAAAEYQTGDKTTAKETIKEANARLAKVTSVDEWRPVDFAMLKLGVTEYCKILVKMSQQANACALAGKVRQWFEKDEEFKAFYDALCN